MISFYKEIRPKHKQFVYSHFSCIMYIHTHTHKHTLTHTQSWARCTPSIGWDWRATVCTSSSTLCPTFCSWNSFLSLYHCSKFVRPLITKKLLPRSFSHPILPSTAFPVITRNHSYGHPSFIISGAGESSASPCDHLY